MIKKIKKERKNIKKGAKQINPFKTKQKKYSKRDTIALILALVAVGFFIIYSIVFLYGKQEIIDSLSKNISEFPELIEYLPSLITIFAIIWLVFAIFMSFIIYKIEKKEYKWYSLLIISILSIFTANPYSCFFGIISSILYIKHHK